MSYEIAIFVSALIDSAVLLFIAIFCIVNLSDLECDYVNARTCCNRLNKIVFPEVIAQVLLTVAVISTLHLFPISINLPMTLWIIYRSLTMVSDGSEFYDPTEILNRNRLKMHLKESLVKLGYHLLAFFCFLYCLVMELQPSTEELPSPAPQANG